MKCVVFVTTYSVVPTFAMQKTKMLTQIFIASLPLPMVSAKVSKELRDERQDNNVERHFEMSETPPLFSDVLSGQTNNEMLKLKHLRPPPQLYFHGDRLVLLYRYERLLNLFVRNSLLYVHYILFTCGTQYDFHAHTYPVF